jgi:hypothetical protein
MKLKNKAEILYDKTPEAAYWIGFLSADGSFEKRGKIKVGLGIKDKDHLLKLVKFINYTGSIRECEKSIEISFMNKKIKQLMKEYDIKPNKTYNPPIDIPYTDPILRLSYCIGFIDGDGSIKNYTKRKSFFLTIKNHGSWEEMLKIIGKEISNKFTVKINKRSYAVLTMCNTTNLKSLKTMMLSAVVPYMERKWNIINLNYKSRMEDTPEKIIKITNLLGKYKQKDIGKLLNMKDSALSLFIKRHNIKETKGVTGGVE